jgi:hypothetical protein
MKRILKYTEFVSNILIICVVVGVAVLYGVNRFLPAPPAGHPVVGSALILPGETFSNYPETLVLALQDTCHFCSESAPFYRRLEKAAQFNKKVHLVVILPPNNNPDYVKQLGLTIHDVKLTSFSPLHVGGTPTLIWIDNRGIVKKSWIGKLIPRFEQDVFNSLNLVEQTSSNNVDDASFIRPSPREGTQRLER